MARLATIDEAQKKIGDLTTNVVSLQELLGDKRAREMWFLNEMYTAQQAYDMGLVNKVVPHAELEAEAPDARPQLELVAAALPAAAAGDGLAHAVFPVPEGRWVILHGSPLGSTLGGRDGGGDTLAGGGAGGGGAAGVGCRQASGTCRVQGQPPPPPLAAAPAALL